MKREREDGELEERVEEIVAIVNAKDKEGKYIHPLMYEKHPMILTFFHAKDALLSVLINKPVLFLNLLQTNTTMATFWTEFEKNIWILLLERLIWMEMGEKAVDIYPFFHIEHIATYGKEIGGALPMGGSAFVTHQIETGVRLDKRADYYYQEYDKHDIITQKFIALLLYITKYKSRPSFDIEEALLGYLGLPFDYTGPYIGCLANGFLTEQPDVTNKLVFNGWALRNTLYALIINKDDYKREHTNYLAYSLESVLFSTKPCNTFKENSVLLTRENTEKYRKQLYDEKEGLYNTPKKQRDFFLKILGGTRPTPKEVITEYGSRNLECFMCRKESTQVDLIHTLSFCDSECHSYYLSSFL